MSDFKNIKQSTDQVSALMFVASQVFQLEPSFAFTQLSKDAHARDKFLCTVKLLDCDVAASLGQNKPDSKRNAARCALHKVAPRIYDELFEGVQPPENHLLKQAE